MPEVVEELQAARRLREDAARLREAKAQAEARQDAWVKAVEREARREWVNRMIWRFGWFRAIPETLQPIIIGLVISLPIVLAVVFYFQ